MAGGCVPPAFSFYYLLLFTGGGQLSVRKGLAGRPSLLNGFIVTIDFYKLY